VNSKCSNSYAAVQIWATVPVPVARVFNIITVDEYIELWLGVDAGVRCRLEANVGGRFSVHGQFFDGFSHSISGITEQYKQYERIVVRFRCRPGYSMSELSVTLHQAVGSTEIRLSHTGLISDRQIQIAEEFWEKALKRMTILMGCQTEAFSIISSVPDSLVAS